MWCLALSFALALADTPPSLSDVCARFAGHDVDGDGTAEIDRLTPVGETHGDDDASLVLLLIEGRLLESSGVDGQGDLDLRPALDRLAADIAADGFRAAVVRADLYRGERHQDGRVLLALRRFLGEMWPAGLGGAVLIGSFPEALLVRTCNWRKRTPIELRRGTASPIRYTEPVEYLRSVPEAVAHTCDLVLADLDGGWEALYLEPPTALQTLYAIFPGGVPDWGGRDRRVRARLGVVPGLLPRQRWTLPLGPGRGRWKAGAPCHAARRGA